MHHDSTLSATSISSSSAATAVLRAARRLHKEALSAAPSQCLPVLRRVLATGSLRELSLPQLHQKRALVRRKHILRTLAIEAGHASWESYREALTAMRAEDLPHFDLLRGAAAYPNLWFCSLAEAQAYAAVHGGRALAVGKHAVIEAQGNG
ncbi:MAG: hypothetical protein LBE21_11210 [Pseudomonadales bacterium]|jgi:hypothetical protein|nr:hypothetical protein [Pseudomonadales bacterium]